MNATLRDASEISQKIDAYVEGCQTGDDVHLKRAFHPDARMFGHMGGNRFDSPIFGGMDAAVAQQPVGQYDARILSIDVAGDVASVKIAESGFWGQDFIDYFLLARIGGEWQIVAKAFDHSGETAALTS